MATRLYSSISVETTLASSINNSTTSMTVATGTATTLLGGVTVVANSQFTVAIDPDTISEEIVFITAGPSGDTFTIVRARAGSSAVAHSTGATIKHVLTSDDLTAFAAGISPVSNLAFSGSTSGTTTLQATAVAGTNTLSLPPTTTDTLVGVAATQTLTGKTLTSPTINTATVASSTLSAATLTGTLTAGGGVGTNGQVLQSTGTGVQWGTPSAPANATATVATSQTTTSTSYTDLATSGPAVTLTTGTKALVIITCASANTDINRTCLMSYAVSGATTIAASDSVASVNQNSGQTSTMRYSLASVPTLTAGSNTFTAKYAVNAGTGTFWDREIFVINLA